MFEIRVKQPGKHKFVLIIYDYLYNHFYSSIMDEDKY